MGGDGVSCETERKLGEVYHKATIYLGSSARKISGETSFAALPWPRTFKAQRRPKTLNLGAEQPVPKALTEAV